MRCAASFRSQRSRFLSDDEYELEDEDIDWDYDEDWDDWEEPTKPESRSLRDVEDMIAEELGLNPEALQAFKSMNSEMEQVLTNAEEEVMERASIDESRISRRNDEKDGDVVWIEVDGVPVYRAQFLYHHNGVRLYASWLPNGLLRLNAN